MALEQDDVYVRKIELALLITLQDRIRVRNRMIKLVLPQIHECAQTIAKLPQKKLFKFRFSIVSNSQMRLQTHISSINILSSKTNKEFFVYFFPYLT